MTKLRIPRPDLLVHDEDETPVLAVEAKVRESDYGLGVDQIVSYMAAMGVPYGLVATPSRMTLLHRRAGPRST